MPSLILSSQYTTDSQRLREAARRLNWETLRLDGDRLPDWFDPPDDQIAMFYTAPRAFDVASQLNRSLVGCPPDWTISLPRRFLSRDIRQTTLADALNIAEPQFVKHSVSKAFPAAVYNSETLRLATENVAAQSIVHVGEPVTFEIEYRCFISNRRIATACAYLRFGEAISDHSPMSVSTQAELEAALAFANSVLASDAVRFPPAFVLDVGRIAERGWAVVEFNECWASGIYACDPEMVLETLLCACLPTPSIDTEWDFRNHYAKACCV
jgi:hypothetical protein